MNTQAQTPEWIFNSQRTAAKTEAFGSRCLVWKGVGGEWYYRVKGQDGTAVTDAAPNRIAAFKACLTLAKGIR